MRRPSTSPPSSRGRRGSTASGCASASSRCRRGRCLRRSPAAPVSGSTPGAAAAPSGRCAKRLISNSGGPDMAPTPPTLGSAPAKPWRLLGLAFPAWGAPIWPPLPPTLGSGPAKPCRPSVSRCLCAMPASGGPAGFGPGDRDLATHLVRTRALRAGQSLSAVTAELARALGVAPRLLPMSDQAVRTTIRTPDGRLGFQEYFVRDKCQVEVLAVDYDGAAGARPAPGVLEAIRDADRVVVADRLDRKSTRLNSSHG